MKRTVTGTEPHLMCFRSGRNKCENVAMPNEALRHENVWENEAITSCILNLDISGRQYRKTYV